MSKEMGPREEMAGQPQLSQGRLQVEGRDGSSCIGHLHLVNVTAVVSQQRGGGTADSLHIDEEERGSEGLPKLSRMGELGGICGRLLSPSSVPCDMEPGCR